MELNRRTIGLGALVAVAVIILAVALGASLLLVGALVVVAALGVTVLYQRSELAEARTRREDEVEDEGDWEDDDEESVDLSFVDEYIEPRPSGDLAAGTDLFETEESGILYEEEAPEDEFAAADFGSAATDTAEVEYDEVEVEAEVEYDEVEVEYDEVEVEYEDVGSDGEGSELVVRGTVDEEFEEAIAGYDEPAYGGVVVDEEELLDDTGLIDPSKVTSDEAILGAAHVSSFTPDEEEANEETREILGRVAALLAKYE